MAASLQGMNSTFLMEQQGFLKYVSFLLEKIEKISKAQLDTDTLQSAFLIEDMPYCVCGNVSFKYRNETVANGNALKKEALNLYRYLISETTDQEHNLEAFISSWNVFEKQLKLDQCQGALLCQQYQDS